MTPKVLLILPMVIFELVLLCIGWVLAFINPELAQELVDWAMKLPNKSWYFH